MASIREKLHGVRVAIVRRLRPENRYERAAARPPVNSFERVASNSNLRPTAPAAEPVPPQSCPAPPPPPAFAPPPAPAVEPTPAFDAAGARAFLAAAREEITCPIDFLPMLQAVIMPCGHAFSAAAWNGWRDSVPRQQTPTCPSCRAAVPRAYANAPAVDQPIQDFARSFMAAFPDTFVDGAEGSEKTLEGASEATLRTFMESLGDAPTMPHKFDAQLAGDVRSAATNQDGVRVPSEAMLRAVRAAGTGLRDRLRLRLHDHDFAVRLESLYAFTALVLSAPSADDTAVLEALTLDSNPDIAAVALRAYVAVAGQATAPRVTAMCQSAAGVARQAAMEAAAQLGLDRRTPMQRAIANTFDTDFATRLEAMYALERLARQSRNEAAIARMEELTHHRHGATSAQALTFYVAIAGREAAPRVLQLLTSSVPEVRRAGRDAMVSLGLDDRTPTDRAVAKTLDADFATRLAGISELRRLALNPQSRALTVAPLERATHDRVDVISAAALDAYVAAAGHAAAPRVRDLQHVTSGPLHMAVLNAFASLNLEHRDPLERALANSADPDAHVRLQIAYDLSRMAQRTPNPRAAQRLEEMTHDPVQFVASTALTLLLGHNPQQARRRAEELSASATGTLRQAVVKVLDRS